MPKAMTRRGRASRQRILDAASGLFHRHGVNATSVDDILRQADMGKSQFYHYFASKEELVCAVVEEQMNDILEFLAPHTAELNSVEGLERWFAAYAELARQHELLGCPVGIIAAETSVDTPLVRRQVMRALRRWTESLTQALQRLQREGRLNHRFEPERAAEFIGATIQGALLVGRAFNSPVPLANAGRQLKQYLESYAS